MHFYFVKPVHIEAEDEQQAILKYKQSMNYAMKTGVLGNIEIAPNISRPQDKPLTGDGVQLGGWTIYWIHLK